MIAQSSGLYTSRSTLRTCRRITVAIASSRSDKTLGPRKNNAYTSVKKYNRRYSGDDMNEQHMKPPSADPWKVLVKKLDSTKNDKTRFGKVTNEYMSSKITESIPDQMQCIHFGKCSGCTTHGNFDEVPIVTRARMFFKSENIDMNIHLGKHHEYRTHVKLAVGPLSRWGGLNIGLYREGVIRSKQYPVAGCIIPLSTKLLNVSKKLRRR